MWLSVGLKLHYTELKNSSWEHDDICKWFSPASVQISRGWSGTSISTHYCQCEGTPFTSGAVSHNLVFWVPAGKCHLLCAHWQSSEERHDWKLLAGTWVGQKSLCRRSCCQQPLPGMHRFFLEGNNSTSHTEIIINTWWAISKSQLVPSPCLFPHSPILHCRSFDFSKLF